MKYNLGLMRARKLKAGEDRRKARRGHRKMAKRLQKEGGFFNNFSAVGSTFWCVSKWHQLNARYIGR